MRTFSETEKNYLREIVVAHKNKSWQKLILKNLIYSIFKRSIILSEFPGFEIFESESENKDDIDKFNRAIQSGYIPLAEFLNLLKNLDEAALISIIPYFESDDFDLEVIEIKSEIRSEVMDERQYFSIVDHSYLQFLKRNYSNLINPSQELINLVNCNFQTKEEKRYKTQICATWVSIGVAMIIGLIGFSKPSSPVEINKYQIDKIITGVNNNFNQLKRIEYKLDSINIKMVNNNNTHRKHWKRTIK